MTRDSMLIASILLIATMIVTSALAGLGLPDEARLPIHWGLDGTPDRFAGKWIALLMPAGMATFLSFLFYALPALEPRGENLARSQGLYLWAWLAALIMTAAVQVAMLSAALGWNLPVDRLIVAAMGSMFVLIGNQLGKSRSMFTVGIRTPWTLSSEEVWVATHRLGGRLMVGAGLVAIAAAAFGLSSVVLASVVGVAIALAAIVPIIYSYLLWRRERRA